MVTLIDFAKKNKLIYILGGITLMVTLSTLTVTLSDSSESNVPQNRKAKLMDFGYPNGYPKHWLP